MTSTQGSSADELSGVPESLSVSLLWCDTSGVRRARVIPRTRLRHAVDHGVGVTVNCMGMTSSNDAPCPNSGVDSVGETRLRPELATAKVQPWHPAGITVHADMRTESGIPWDLCPRNALRKVLAQLYSEFGVSLQVGCETEFYLLQELPRRQPDGTVLLEPVDDSKYCQSSSVNSYADDLNAIVDAVSAFGGAVEQWHAESGGGQFEVVTSHMPAFEAADQLVFTREAIVATSLRKGRPAVMLPKLFADGAASGAHLHVSIHKDASNMMSGGSESQHGLQDLGEHFISGVLDHLPGITSFLASSSNSYRRLQPSAWAGAYQVWGINNKETPIRLITGNAASSNCEIKTPDATSNPHLAIAAIATAGLLGLRERSKLPQPFMADPHALCQHARRLQNIKRLPDSLDAAVDALEGDTNLLAGLGEALGGILKAHIAVKRADAKRWKNVSLELEVAELWSRF